MDWIFVLITAGIMSVSTVNMEKMTEEQCRAVLQTLAAANPGRVGMMCISPTGEVYNGQR